MIFPEVMSGLRARVYQFVKENPKFLERAMIDFKINYELPAS